MKVLHVLASNKLSGAEQVAITIIRGLKQDFDFAYASPPGPIAESLEQSGIKFIPIPSMSRKNVAKAVKEFNPDIIHAHDYRSSILSASVPAKTPIISHLHNNYPWAKKLNLKTAAYAATSIRFSRILVVSEPILNEHYFSGILKEKVVIMPNVIDVEAARALALSAEAPQTDILFVGRITEQKDPIAFIELVARLQEKIPNIKASMIGEGELEEACKQKITEYSLEHNIKMLGFLANPYPYMPKAKMLVMPSRWEGFGLVALESMALGTPVLCTPVGGLVTIVENGKNGYFCSTLDEFTKRTIALMQDSNLLQNLSLQSMKCSTLTTNTNEYFLRIKKLYYALIK